MTEPMSISRHVRATLSLGLPLIGSQVAQFAINLVDTIMLGWYDVTVLAGQVLGGTMFIVIFLWGAGFAIAVMPMVASAQGAGDEGKVRRTTRMAMWISIAFGILILPLFLWSGPIFRAMGQEADVAAYAADYAQIIGFTIMPALLVMVLKNYLAALEHTKVVLWVMVGAVFVNAFVNYALIFGKFGAPEMGVRGAAIASLVVHLFSLVLLALYAMRALPQHELFARFWRSDREILVEVFRLGWPIGITNVSEVGLFGVSSIMMGWIGTLALASHGIALQIAATVFMVHLGFASAGTVRAGRAFGRGDWIDLRRGAGVVVALSLGVAAIATVFMVLWPEFFLGLFMDPEDPLRPQVLATGAAFLIAAGFFQLFDAAQAIALGLLRGIHDTKVPMVMAAVSYWVVGLPVSYVTAFMLGWGGVGIWFGLAVGLAVASFLMMARFWIKAPRAA